MKVIQTFTKLKINNKPKGISEFTEDQIKIFDSMIKSDQLLNKNKKTDTGSIFTLFLYISATILDAIVLHTSITHKTHKLVVGSKHL
jgi:hypothetical protein